MRTHNVLILAYYFPPMGLSGVQRISKFVKYLPEFGWRPHVLTTGPTAYYAHDETLLDDFVDRDIIVTRTEGMDPGSMLKKKGTMKMPAEGIRKFLSGVSNTFFIPDNKKSWSNRALTVARDLLQAEQFDMIFVSGPPFSTMMAGAQLSAESGVPLVLDYRDLWYGNQFHTYPTMWHSHRHKQLEYETLTHASKVTVTNRRIKERLLNTYRHLDFNDVVIVPHGFDPEDLSWPSAQRQAPSLFDGQPSPFRQQRDTFMLSYAGIFYDFVSPVPFFKAVKKVLQERPDIPLELHFAGLLRDEYRRKAKKMGLLDHIVDHEYLPHRDTVRLLQESDALWMMVGKARNADTISSGKLYEYFGTRKPLLVSVPEGALRSDAQKYGAAWITEPSDVSAIAAAIIDMHDQWRKGALPQPDETFVQRFDRRQLTGDLARVLAGSLRVL